MSEADHLRAALEHLDRLHEALEEIAATVDDDDVMLSHGLALVERYLHKRLALLEQRQLERYTVAAAVRGT